MSCNCAMSKRSCGRPDFSFQTRYNVEIKSNPRTTVKGRGDTADDHKVNVMVVKLAQNFEKVARHGFVVAPRPGARSSGF